MKFEQGFGRFTEGEELNVELLGIGYTKKNRRPYARVLAEGGEQAFNINIADKDKGLPKGRYKIVCTGVNANGFCYVAFHKLQHSSWDKRDEALGNYDSLRDEVAAELERVEINENNVLNSADMVFCINLTRHFSERLKYKNSMIKECIQNIENELTRKYGEKVLLEGGYYE